MGPTPIDDSFEVAYEGGQKVGPLIEVVIRTDMWRFVGRNRFVLPSCRASCPTYVEWRREGDKWVISAFGDEWFQDPERQHPYF